MAVPPCGVSLERSNARVSGLASTAIGDLAGRFNLPPQAGHSSRDLVERLADESVIPGHAPPKL